MKKSILPLYLVMCNVIFAQNQQPVLSNVQLQLSGNNTFLINYDLADVESDPVSVSLRAGTFGATALDYDTDNATGDVGSAILPGTGKQISWDFSAYAASAMNDFRIMLVADDGQPIDIQSLVDLVDSTRLIDDLTFIEGVRHRAAGSVHLQETKDFIFLQFLNQGLEAYLQPFAYGGYDAHNIIGRHPATGTSGDTYILGGHFDTVSDSPGADDNGSAVAGMLEAMRILSKYPTKKAIKFIGFDLEEANLIGSSRYVSNGIPNGEVIAGMVDFEMIGYYSESPNSQTFPPGFNLLFPDAYNAVASQEFKGNFITNVGRVGNSSSLMQAYQNAAATYVPALRSIAVESPSVWPPDLGRSDHAPFWVANRPAIMLTDGANFRNPHYHTPGDMVGTLNFTFMANAVKATVALLAQLAEVQHADVWWKDTDFFTKTKEEQNCNLKISPNPVQDLLLFDWSDCPYSVNQLTLLDSMGRTVMTVDTIGSQHQLNLGQIASGIYFLKIKSGQGTRLERIVVE
jgi:hypothetical protein